MAFHLEKAEQCKKEIDAIDEEVADLEETEKKRDGCTSWPLVTNVLLVSLFYLLTLCCLLFQIFLPNGNLRKQLTIPPGLVYLTSISIINTFILNISLDNNLYNVAISKTSHFRLFWPNNPGIHCKNSCLLSFSLLCQTVDLKFLEYL